MERVKASTEDKVNKRNNEKITEVSEISTNEVNDTKSIENNNFTPSTEKGCGFNGQPLFAKPKSTPKNDNKKRPHSDTSSYISDATIQIDQKNINQELQLPTATPVSKTEKDYKTKKPKTKPFDSVDLFQVAEKEISSSTSAAFPIDYEQLANFVIASYDVSYKNTPQLADKIF